MPESAPPRVVPHWEAKLRELDESTLYELRDSLAELSQNPAWRAIIALVSDGKEFLLREIKVGPTREASGYARVAGYVTGLDELSEVAVAIRNVADKVERDHEARAAREEAPLERGHS